MSDIPTSRGESHSHGVVGGDAIRLEPGGTVGMDHQGRADVRDEPLSQRHAVVRRHAVTGDGTIVDGPLGNDVAGSVDLKRRGDRGQLAAVVDEEHRPPMDASGPNRGARSSSSDAA